MNKGEYDLFDVLIVCHTAMFTMVYKVNRIVYCVVVKRTYF